MENFVQPIDFKMHTLYLGNTEPPGESTQEKLAHPEVLLKKFEGLLKKPLYDLSCNDLLEIYEIKDNLTKIYENAQSDTFDSLVKTWRKLKVSFFASSAIVAIKKDFIQHNASMITPYVKAISQLDEYSWNNISQNFLNRHFENDVKLLWRTIKAKLIASSTISPPIFDNYSKSKQTTLCIATNSADLSRMVEEGDCALLPATELLKKNTTTLFYPDIFQDASFISDSLLAYPLQEFGNAHNLTKEQTCNFNKDRELSLFKNDRELQKTLSQNPVRIAIALLRLFRFSHIEKHEIEFLEQCIKNLPDELFKKYEQWNKYCSLIGKSCDGAYGYQYAFTDKLKKKDIFIGDVVGIVRSDGKMQFGVVDVDLGALVRVRVGGLHAKVCSKKNVIAFDDNTLELVSKNSLYSLIGKNIPLQVQEKLIKSNDHKVGDVVIVKRSESDYIFGVFIEPTIVEMAFQNKIFLGFKKENENVKGEKIIVSNEKLFQLPESDLKELYKPDSEPVNYDSIALDLGIKEITKKKLLNIIHHIKMGALSKESKECISDPFPVVFAAQGIDLEKKSDYVQMAQGIAILPKLTFGKEVQLIFTEKSKIPYLKKLIEPLVEKYKLSIDIMSFESAYYSLLNNSLGS